MTNRYYICGLTSGGAYSQLGVVPGALYPEIADEVGHGWSSVDDGTGRVMVALADESLHDAIAYSESNPDGYDWVEVDGDEVVVHAP